MTSLQFRAATSEDSAFVFAVKRAAFEEYVDSLTD